MNSKDFFVQKLNKVISIDNIISLFYSDLNQKFDSLGERHDFWELVYIDRGKIEIETEDKTFILEKNHIYFHKPDEFHRHKAITNDISSMCVVSFRCDSLLLDTLANHVFFLPEHCQDVFSQVLKYGSIIFSSIVDNEEQLYLIRDKRHPVFVEQMLINYLEIFLLEVLNLNTMTDTDLPDNKAVTQNHGKSNEDLLLAAKAYLRDNLFTKIYIPDMCEALNCSKTLLHVIFKKYTGLSIIQYFNSLKIEKAKELIRTSNLNITEIAERLSFCNINYFSNSFKKHTGMHPSEYAKSIKARDCIRYLYSERGTQIDSN